MAKVFGKVNLTLYIVGVQDGLHQLDSIMTPISLYDEVIFNPQENFELELHTDLAIDKERYLKTIEEKAKKIQDYFGVVGKFTIYKNVPLSCGLGGSSCTLAAMVNELRKITNKPVSNGFFLELGSDVLAVSLNHTCHLKGIGDVVEIIEDRKVDIDIHLVEGGVDTKEAFKLYDEMNITYDKRVIPTTFEQAILNPHNDLFIPACKLNKNIEKTYDLLKEKDKAVSMSGSGSALFLLNL